MSLVFHNCNCCWTTLSVARPFARLRYLPHSEAGLYSERLLTIQPCRGKRRGRKWFWFITLILGIVMSKCEVRRDELYRHIP